MPRAAVEGVYEHPLERTVTTTNKPLLLGTSADRAT
jgi:hypothetical protein